MLRLFQHQAIRPSLDTRCELVHGALRHRLGSLSLRPACVTNVPAASPAAIAA